MPAIRIDKCPHCGGVLRERTTEQNALLHAILSDIAQQKQWAGQKLDVTAWKRLFVAGWERANKRPAEIYPAIDGAGIDIVYRQTSRMAKQDLTDLVEFICAWAAENGVQLREAA